MKKINSIAKLVASLLILTGGALNSQVNLTNGLVAYFPFNGNALDFSGNSNHGNAAGTAGPTTDRWGNTNSAYNFNGTSGWGMITVPNSTSLQFTTAASFSYWVKLNSDIGTLGNGNIAAGGSHCVFAKDGDAGGGLFCNTALSGGNLGTGYGNVSMTQLNNVITGAVVGQWVHYAYIMDATEQRLYVNGVLTNTVPGAPNFAVMNTKNLVMARYTSGWYPMNGALDEFRVYNRALTQAEITSLASNANVSVAVTGIFPSAVCAGSAIAVTISATGIVAVGNTYTVQLSDAAGLFTYPITIGSQTSNSSSATITCSIPTGMPSGSGYKVRVLTDVPVSIGPGSTQPLTINGVLGDIPSASNFRYIGNTSGRDYFVGTTQLTWTAAQALCASNGGYLATIPNAATNNLLYSAVSVNGCHFGLSDAVTEGNYQWVNGASITYTNWSAGEPNNSGNEDYTHMMTTGKWNDIPNVSSGYFLELNPVSSNSPVCSGSSIYLYAASLSGATYNWTGPNNFTSTLQNPVIPVAATNAAGTYTLVITKNGCNATLTTTVVVQQGPSIIGQNSPLASSLASGIVLHYPLNGNAADVSGNNLHGTLVGGVQTVTDRFGNPGGAIELNGSNGYVDVPDDTFFTGSDFSVSCWVKAYSYPTWSRVFDFGNGPANNNVLMALSVGTSGRPAAEIYVNNASGGQISSSSVQTGVNVWTNLVYTYTSGTGRLYVNGTLAAQGPQTAPQNVMRTLCYIGKSNWTVTDAYAWGAFDDFRIYNRAITTVEIQSLLMEQSDVCTVAASPAFACVNSAGVIKVSGTQYGVTYQLQNSTTSANIGGPQNGNGDTLSFTTSAITANTAFNVVASGPLGCNAILGPVTISTLTSSSATITASGNTAFCAGDSVVLTAQGGNLFQWSTGATTSSITVMNSGNYYVVVSNGICSDTSSITPVLVMNAPSAIISASGPLTFCTGDNVTLSVPAATGYQWNEGSTTQSIQVDTSGAYSVTVTDINGCTATSAVVTVNVVAPPSAMITPTGTISICQGDGVTLTASGGTSYVWSDNSGSTTLYANQAGTYYVIASNGFCSDTSSSVTITENALPTVSLAMGADTFFCVNHSPITLNGGSPSGGTYSGPGVTGNTFDPASAGTGNITLTYSFTDSLGCMNSASYVVYVDVCTDIVQTAEGYVSAYPVPTDDVVNLQWRNEDRVKLIRVYDAYGKLVWEEQLTQQTTVQLKMHDWSAGIYNVMLIGNTIRQTKVIRE